LRQSKIPAPVASRNVLIISVVIVIAISVPYFVSLFFRLIPAHKGRMPVGD
jgi:hypothetical protein